MWVTPPELAPEVPEDITITFAAGVPTAVNGKTLEPVEIIEELNTLGSKHGIGIIDIVENRLVGMKSRGVYETPGGTIIYEAHKALEKLVLDRATLGYKNMVSLKYAELIYDGMWFSELMGALTSFIDTTQEKVSGEVKMKLYKGACLSAGTTSCNSLYSEEFVTFGEDEVYNQQDAEGFINLFTLPLKMKALQESGQLAPKKESETA